MRPVSPYGFPVRFVAALWFFVVCYLVYGGNADHALLHWDDITYISTNPWIIDPSWDSVLSMFTEFRLLNWHPLTWLSYVPEYYLCGESAWCYKNTNIFLHGINSYLVFCITILVFSKLDDGIQNRAGLMIAGLVGGTLFALHTQHVESVIWVAERKDVLCAVFYFAGLYSYLKYHIAQCSKLQWVPFLFFFLALLSKPMAITFPLILILLDYYPLGRLDKKNLPAIIREKVHYILGSGVVFMIALLSQDVASVQQPDLADSFWKVCMSIKHYLLALVYLVEFSPFHPETEISDRNILDYAALLIITVAGIISMVKYKRPAVFFILFFLISILPVIGIIKIGEHAYADRYSYIPTLPFYIFAGWLISYLWYKAEKLRYGLLIVVISVMISMGYTTHNYKDIWKSDRDLWAHVASLYPQRSFTVHNNLGNSLVEAGEYELAIEQYNLAMTLDSSPVPACRNRAYALNALGRSGDVLTSYDECIKITPGNYLVHLYAGDAYLQQEFFEVAHGHYIRALDLFTLNPENVIQGPDALIRLGEVFFYLGDHARAVYSLELVAKTSQERRHAAQVILDENL